MLLTNDGNSLFYARRMLDYTYILTQTPITLYHLLRYGILPIAGYSLNVAQVK